jgi:hypothetical protein
MTKEEGKDQKKKSSLSPEDVERLELLQKANEKKGMQLTIADTGDLKEINEVKQLIGKDFENPEEKYQLYYKGIRNLLMQYLPKGEMYEDGRQIIYDEKNIFLNRGKKKSDGDGIRGSDGRMTYQENMSEILDLILKWLTESQKPIELYNMLYDLNEKYGYGHEAYDNTNISYVNAVKKIKES